MKPVFPRNPWTAALVLSLAAAATTSCSSSQSSSSGTTNLPVTAPANSSTVDFGTTEQTIRGFGGSTAFLATLTSQDASELFATSGSQQIGLSLLRVRIDPAGQVNWGSELYNAQQAVSRGASVFATPWTPPASMKSNSNTVGGSLNASSYAAYATYLESYVNYMSANGVNLYAISMQNEPDAVVTYESCTWTPTQMETWVQNNASVITTKLMMPESESFLTGYSDPTLNSSAAAANVSIVGGHLYGVSPAYYTNAVSKGKEVWMTEHYTSGETIANAMTMAKEISDSMDIGQYNAYVWWWVKDDTIGLLNSSDQVTVLGYTMEQWSKFIRPGYQRVNTTYNPATNVYVTAYAGSGHDVIVAVNVGTTPVSQGFATTGAAGLTSVTPYQTSSTLNFSQLTPIAVGSNGVFVASLPAQSVTTFYQ